MRATGTIPAERPSVRSRLAGDVRRAFLACGICLALCVIAALIANAYQVTEVRHPPSEATLSTGSMLVVAPVGDRCRERTIDNRTWRIQDKGFVNCEEALAKAASLAAESRSSGSRLAIIREGFLGRQ